MRKIGLSLIVLGVSFTSCAQHVPQRQVPAIVLNTFQKLFPRANDIEWEMKGGLYEVEFETGLSGKDHKMLIDSMGRITYHESEIAKNELPDSVRNTITAQFAGYALDDIEKIESNGIVTYSVELEKKLEEWEVVFSPDGKIISKTAK